MSEAKIATVADTLRSAVNHLSVHPDHPIYEALDKYDAGVLGFEVAEYCAYLDGLAQTDASRLASMFPISPTIDGENTDRFNLAVKFLSIGMLGTKVVATEVMNITDI